MRYGSLVNLLEDGLKTKDLQVGVGVTMLSWTDRTAGTVIAFDDKTITVQRDHAKRILKDGENPMSDSQDYEYYPNPNGTITVYKKARNGKFTHNGKNAGTGLIIGERDEYYDYSF